MALEVRCPTSQVKIGHILDVLREMPSESVQCAATSPPYWGLRKYDIPDVVWDGDPFCEHEWGALPTSRVGRDWDATLGVSPVQRDYKPADSAFCFLCNAWRGQLGLEPTIDLFVQHMVEIFAEVRRVLRRDGVLWLNIGDTYISSANSRSAADTKAIGNDDRTFRDKPDNTLASGLKPKNRAGIPERVVLALQADGWYWRDEIIWHKPSAMPSSVTDRTTPAHEKIYLLAKSARYYYDSVAVQERAVCEHSSGNGYAREQQIARGGRGSNEPIVPTGRGGKSAFRGQGHFREDEQGRANRDGRDMKDVGAAGMRNRRSVWTINTSGFAGAHFATFPPDLVAPMILAGTSEPGRCAGCGKPLERVIDRVAYGSKVGIGDRLAEGFTRNNLGGQKEWDSYIGPKTLGWRKTCKCDTIDTAPCVVLDPFCGAGTTGMVAMQLGRDFIGIDLGYEKMSRKRIANAAMPIPGLLAEVATK